MSRYSEVELTRFVLQDILTDIRCARRDNMPEYEQRCIAEFRRIWTKRHQPKLNRYGWPT